jgi:acetyl esterase
LTAAAEDLLRSVRASGFDRWSALSVEEARTLILGLKAFAGPPEPVSRVEQVRIARGDGSELTGELYVPDSTAPVPIMVYLHGGGWVLADHTGVDSLVRTLVNRSGWAVVSIDYSLAPERRYPGALEDVRRTLDWVIENAENRGLSPGCLAVGGDSSGANLAAAASLLCRDEGGPRLAFQMLVYPPLDHNYETEAYRQFGDGVSSALSREDMAWFQNLYVSSADELDSPYVSPLRATSFAGLPETLVICAELDPLVDDGVEYTRRLQQAGVSVDLQIYPGMFHGFWWMAGVLPEARAAIDYAGSWMRKAGESTRLSDG